LNVGSRSKGKGRKGHTTQTFGASGLEQATGGKGGKKRKKTFPSLFIKTVWTRDVAGYGGGKKEDNARDWIRKRAEPNRSKGEGKRRRNDFSPECILGRSFSQKKDGRPGGLSWKEKQRGEDAGRNHLAFGEERPVVPTDSRRKKRKKKRHWGRRQLFAWYGKRMK